MRIQIRNHYKPFTHKPGARVIVPFSHYALHVFPTKIFVLDLLKDEHVVAELDFCLFEYCESFSTELDLEKGIISIHGTTSDHFFRYFVFFEEDKILFHLDKSKGECFKVIHDSLELLKLNGKLPSKRLISPEKISFGIFKKLNFENIHDREDMREILPLWHALAKQIPKAAADFLKPSLLSDLKEEILHQRKEGVLPLFKALFKTGFHSLLCPKMNDHAFQGFTKPPLIGTTPLALLSEGASLIRSLLIDYKENTLKLLPLVPKELASGRVTGFPLGNAALLDIEWRSGRLLKAFFTISSYIDMNIILPNDIKSFRVRDLKKNSMRQERSGEPLSFKEGSAILLDRFIH